MDIKRIKICINCNKTVLRLLKNRKLSSIANTIITAANAPRLFSYGMSQLTCGLLDLTTVLVIIFSLGFILVFIVRRYTLTEKYDG